MAEEAHGLGRHTRQRLQVTALLEETDEFRSAQRLHEMLRARGVPVGLTTVYRTLQILSDAGEVDVIRLPSGEHLYRRCGAGRHHHLVCRHCARTVEIPGPGVEQWARRIARQHGYVDVAQTLELFGTCADCAAQGRT
ncbi:Fur family transcriptional regulator [Phytohabitans sp. ZYX-F-186]|uniref:Fur family transcriptional regulator n=1 Tax=Phytohabitans maris TaxID=3071409 RepID=A0ABU0ZSH3_9ACTN|nr:Fur family transcriptional regulator [Phytohabitans sp. ZYX-F-186]MDQ7909957.1 Fur family transcriptional regulator [Phytohabitans sp. ZYX-F-186]